MNSTQLIQKIANSNRIGEVFASSNWKRAYRAAVFQLHPDRSNDPKAATALMRLNELRAAHERGRQFQDDAGRFHAFDWGVRFEGTRELLQRSQAQYNKLRVLRNQAAQHFQRFLPEEMVLEQQLTATWSLLAVPLSGRTLPLQHVKWILSRLLEFSAWLAQESYVHGGLNPESIWMVPKTRGIIIGSFYHLQRRGVGITMASAQYKLWYPSQVFVDKQAITQTDLEMCKRTAAYLLGDKSGSGVQLRKTQPPAIVDFLLATHTDAYKCYDDFRQLPL